MEKRIELNIIIDLEMNSLAIRNGLYSVLDYECNSLNEVGEIMQEYINEFVKGGK